MLGSLTWQGNKLQWCDMDCDKYQSYVWSEVYFKEPFVLEAVGTKHVCVRAGALDLLGEVSLNKLVLYLKMMMTGDSFCTVQSRPPGKPLLYRWIICSLDIKVCWQWLSHRA